MENPPVTTLDETDLNDDLIALKNFFTSHFGTNPNFYARVPGRVNLIGEHIDYCGFAVLPMAIEKDILLAVKPNFDNTINLVNFDSDKYKEFSTSVDDFVIDSTRPQWYHYFLCGYKGISEQFRLLQMGFDIAVKGTVPPSSGLSSSSALVCASALAISFANKIFLSKMEIASSCAMFERYIGTQGGGMDQAIGFLGESGTAKLIEFNPLKASNVPLPEEVVFVVCNSCVAMNKAATSQFNIRVAECKLAAKVLAKKYQFDWRKVDKLVELPLLLKKSIFHMKKETERHLHKNSYTREELCTILEISDEEFNSMLSANTKHVENFQLCNRAKHVFMEAARVMEFKMVCEEGNNDVKHLGDLMNESHKSCRDLYECSHPILDELVETALNAGAIGSRLTGAGWGGCCISMVMKTQVEKFLEAIKKFYEKRVKECPGIDLNSVVFITKPSKGAEIFVA